MLLKLSSWYIFSLLVNIFQVYLDTLGLGKLLDVLSLVVLIKLVKISVLLEKLLQIINTVEKIEVESLTNHTKFGTTVNFLSY